MLRAGHLRGVDAVLGPLDHARAALAESHGGPDSGEVVELLRIDPAHLGSVEAVDQEGERRSGRLAGVVPALERADDEGVLEHRPLAPLDGIH